ncbi:MAG: hypothetical protein EXR95_02785 [Gemmatimonadetes bacterium]|nr:hypothetical protein [Gemmatimonadota bacterium]
MARDHGLALSLPDGHAVLRLYRWERPTLSLGRNEPALGRYDRERAALRGIDIVRRPTGGRAVLHWRELTYAVVVPARAFGGARGAYRHIHALIAAGLGSLGVPAMIAAEPDRAAPLDAGLCFAGPAGGEIIARGRKLVGSAQLRVGDTLLQHGSILVEDDQALVSALAFEAGPDPSPPATVSDLLGRVPGDGEIERALLDAFGLCGPCAPEPADPYPLERELEQRYRSEAWTWRR